MLVLMWWWLFCIHQWAIFVIDENTVRCIAWIHLDRCNASDIELLPDDIPFSYVSVYSRTGWAPVELRERDTFPLGAQQDERPSELRPSVICQ